MTLRAVALWVAAVAVAVAASTTAVTLATNSVTQPPPVGLASPQGDPSPDAEPTVADTSNPGPAPTDGATAALPPAHDTTAGPTHDDGGDGPGDDPSRAASPTPDAGGPRPDPSPATTQTQERTATSLGGTARFRFEAGDVTVVFATPAQGFTVDVDDEGSEVRVTFTSADHESRIDADHEDGHPRVRVREEAEDH